MGREDGVGEGSQSLPRRWLAVETKRSGEGRMQDRGRAERGASGQEGNGQAVPGEEAAWSSWLTGEGFVGSGLSY